MAENRNFRWLANDIDSTLVLKVIDKNGSEADSKVFNIKDVLETTGDKLEIETANIDDLTNLLTLGIVRFVNISDARDILDIPFRNLYMLYENGNILGNELHGRLITFKELETFSVIDDEVRDDLLVFSGVIGEVTDDLKEVMLIASKFSQLGMQEKFNAMSKVTMINHRRLIADKRDKSFK